MNHDDEKVISALTEKVEKYEQFLHDLNMYAEVTLNHKKAQRLVNNACDWSYAHRVGNGELSDEEQDAKIRRAFDRLTKVD